MDVATWTSLLAGWMELARAAKGLGDRGDDPAWKASIVSVVTLHAVTMALGELDRLEPGERPVALDRAAVLVDRHGSVLAAAWGARPRPRSIEDLKRDAREALEAARERWRSRA